MIIAYNKALSNFKEITHAVFVQMTAYYNGIGKLSMSLPIDAYNISAIEDDGVIYDTVRDMSFTIQAHAFDTSRNTLTVNGYTCNWLLNKRVLGSKIEIRSAEQDVYRAVSENLRGLYRVSINDAAGQAEDSENTLYGGQLLDAVLPVLEGAQLGQKMLWDPDRREHIFTIYRGRDLTEGIHAISFSEENGTASDLFVSADRSLLKTVAYIRASLEDETQILEIVGDPETEDSREYWSETILRQEKDETESELRTRMRQTAAEELAERIARETFTVTIDPSEYGSSYRLGDIVSCVSVRLGVEMKFRISGVKYTLDAKGETVNLILGDPSITVLKEVILNGRY